MSRHVCQTAQTRQDDNVQDNFPEENFVQGIVCRDVRVELSRLVSGSSCSITSLYMQGLGFVQPGLTQRHTDQLYTMNSAS